LCGPGTSDNYQSYSLCQACFDKKEEDPNHPDDHSFDQFKGFDKKIQTEEEITEAENLKKRIIFMSYVESGDLKNVKSTVDAGLDLSAPEYQNILTEAAGSGNVQLFKYLADEKKCVLNGTDVFAKAMENGQTEFLKYLKDVRKVTPFNPDVEEGDCQVLAQSTHSLGAMKWFFENSSFSESLKVGGEGEGNIRFCSFSILPSFLKTMICFRTAPISPKSWSFSSPRSSLRI
jgi:hypothetical protein